MGGSKASRQAAAVATTQKALNEYGKNQVPRTERTGARPGVMGALGGIAGLTNMQPGTVAQIANAVSGRQRPRTQVLPSRRATATKAANRKAARKAAP